MTIRTTEDKVDEYYELVAVVNRYRGRYPGLHDLSPSEALKIILRKMEEEANKVEQDSVLVMDAETGEVKELGPTLVLDGKDFESDPNAFDNVDLSNIEVDI